MKTLEFRVCWHRLGACWLVRLSNEVRDGYQSLKQAVAGTIEAAGAARLAGYDAQIWDEATSTHIYQPSAESRRMGAPRRLADVAGTGAAKEVSDVRCSGWPKSTDATLKELLLARRSLEEALADLHEKYQRVPNPDLARKIELLRDEIEVRKRPVKPSEVVYNPVPERTGPALARMLPWWRRVNLKSRRWISRSL